MPKNEYIRCRVTAEEKKQFTEKAKAIGSTESALARARLLSDKKLIVLSGGKKIVSLLYALNTNFETAKQTGTLSVEGVADFGKGLGKVAALLCEIAQYTADLSSEDEEDPE